MVLYTREVVVVIHVLEHDPDLRQIRWRGVAGLENELRPRSKRILTRHAMASRRVLDPYVVGVVLLAARIVAVAVLLAR